MMSESIGSIIKSTGVPQILDTTRVFIEKLVGPAVEESGELLRDFVRSFRWRNQIKILQKAQEYAVSANIDVKAVPMRTLVPLLENAGLEDHPTLQDMWASLLTNTAAGSESESASPAFVHILRQLSPTDANFLSQVFTRYGLPCPYKFDRYAIGQSTTIESNDVDASLDNVIRLRILQMEDGSEDGIRKIGEALEYLSSDDFYRQRTPHRRWESSDTMGLEYKRHHYELSRLGIRFVLSVSPPCSRPISEPWSPDSKISDLSEWSRFSSQLSGKMRWNKELGQELQESSERTFEEIERRHTKESN